MHQGLQPRKTVQSQMGGGNQSVQKPINQSGIQPNPHNQRQKQPVKANSSALPNGVSGKLVPSDQRIGVLQDNYSDKQLKQLGVIECATCAARTYQDDSNDGSVSFQSPTQLAPSEAASAVMAHEMEHVSNEQQNAKSEGREVVSQSVQIHTSVCPECGQVYVAGGVTKTTTASKSGGQGSLEQNPVGQLMDLSF